MALCPYPASAMQRVGGGDGSRRDPRATKADVEQAEDFLFHLHRGSEMLLKNRVLEAKEELERALHFQPQDAKSQDLLAGVYFRLGLYPRAIEIWSSLVAAYPSDATLRVNLALAYVKTGQTDDALEHVMGALRIQPDHERAWGYLGLVHWRRGKVAEARDAFLRAGQASMARRMEELLAEDSETGHANVERHRDAADDVLRAISDPPPPRELVVRPSRMPPPPSPAPSAAPSASPPMTVDDVVATSRRLAVDDSSCSLDVAGRLVVHSQYGFALRVDLADAVSSSAPGLVVHRRFGSTDAVAVLGDDSPFHRFSGQIDALASPPDKRSFQVIRVDSPIVVVESRLAGFSSGLELSCESIPLVESDLLVVRFSGTGELVVLAEPTIRVASVALGRDTRVRPSSLVGFTGSIAASASTGVSPLALVLRGEGAALLA